MGRGGMYEYKKTSGELSTTYSYLTIYSCPTNLNQNISLVITDNFVNEILTM